MKRAVLLIVALALFACSEPTWKSKPVSEPGERVYPITGVINNRDTVDNTLNVKHEKIEGFMDAMTMDYSVRGADVKTLPADGSRFVAKVHATSNAYWLTDVQPAK